MQNFFAFLLDCFSDIIDFFNFYSFQFLGFSVSLLDIFIGFLATSMVIGLFWKGARG